MSEDISKKGREMVTLLSDLARSLRCCQQEAVFCENVTFTQFFILDKVSEKGQLRLSELHDILSVEKSTTTRLVDPLVKQGMLLRKKADHDSRAVNLILTEKGRDVQRRVWDCLSGFIDSLEQRIPGPRRREVYEAVKIFLDAMKNACTAGQCRTLSKEIEIYNE